MKYEEIYASAETSGSCNADRRRVNRGDNGIETKQKRERNSCFQWMLRALSSVSFIASESNPSIFPRVLTSFKKPYESFTND